MVIFHHFWLGVELPNSVYVKNGHLQLSFISLSFYNLLLKLERLLSCLINGRRILFKIFSVKKLFVNFLNFLLTYHHIPETGMQYACNR